MTDDNATLTVDPPEQAAANTEAATAMDDLARVMGKAGLDGQQADATLPADKGGTPEIAPLETEAAPDKTGDDSKEPAPKAKPEAPTITSNMRQGAKLAKISDEDLAKKSPEYLAMLEEAGQTHARIMGTIGAAKQKAAKALGQAAGKELGAEDDGEGQEDPAAETLEGAPAATAKVADLDGLKDEYGDIEAGKLIETLKQRDTRQATLEQSLASVIEQQEELLVDQFIATLDRGAFSHLGEGPTWRLDKDSPEFKARKDMHELASRYALGVQITEGRPISLLEALARTTNSAEQIRDSALKKKAATQTAAQRHAVHEPGRGSSAKADPGKEAMDQLGATMKKAGIYRGG